MLFVQVFLVSEGVVFRGFGDSVAKALDGLFGCWQYYEQKML